MRRKILPLIVTLLLAFFAASPALAAKSYFAERYDVTLSILPDGALIVTETVVMRFDGGPFTFVKRELDYNNLDVIDRLQAAMDGQVLPQGEGPGQVEIVAARPLAVTWHFAPANDFSREFTLAYRVQGAIRHEDDADTLIWRAIPEDHDYTIYRSTIRVEYPSDMTPIGALTLSGAAAELQAEAGAGVFTVQGVDEDTPVDVTIRFPRGSLINAPPLWQIARDRERQRTAAALPFGLGAAAVTALLGLLGLVLVSQSFRRDADLSPTAPTQTYSKPPRDLSPAIAARLTGSSVPFLGVLFDLARRGVLTIEEGPKRWSGRSFQVVRQPSSTSLQPHEELFLNSLFRKAREGRVPLTDIAALATDSRFGQALDQEITALGWRDEDRLARRSRFLIAVVVALVLGIGSAFAGLIVVGRLHSFHPLALTAGAVLLGFGAAATVVSLAALIYGLMISTLSAAGVQQAAAWNSFGGHLRDISRGRSPAPADLFDRYLPYAAGFGMAAVWAKHFRKQAGIPIPAWFQGLQSSLDDGSFVAVLAAISAAESSAAAASGGDGGGASGGGSSSAG